MRWQVIHDRFFVVLLLVCTAYLLLVARGAQVRERDRLVEVLVADEMLTAQDLAVLEAGLEGVEAGAGDGPDVVFIAVDGLRADALGALGGWGSTPALDALAEGARVARTVQAPSPERAPSQHSLLTGRFPIEHGVYRNKSGAYRRGRTELPTLAERLREAGWSTVGISAQSTNETGRSLERGFDAYLGDGMRPDGINLPYLRADRVTALALEAAEELRGGPRFLWVEYSDPMAPWVAWEPYIESPMSLVSYAMWWPGLSKTGWNKRYQTLMKGSGKVSKDTLETWRTCYSAEVQLVDREIGLLLEGLSGLGIDDNDWVVIVGVNGQYLGERSLLGSGFDVYQEGVGVPLLIRGPAALEAPDSSVAIAGLLLEALGLESDELAVALAVSETRYASTSDLNARYGRRFKRTRRAWRDGDHLLILDDSGPEEAYDLSVDPGQLTPLESAPWVDELRGRAGEWLTDRAAP